MNICFFNIRETAFALVLFHETGTDDTGGDSHGTDTEIGDTDRHDPAECGDGIDVSVAHGEQRWHAPPDAAEGIAEYFRLGIMFHAVHAQTAGEHQDQYDEHGGNDLIAFFIQYRSDDIEGIIPCIQAEQMEDPRHPQHPEDDHAGQEEKG